MEYPALPAHCTAIGKVLLAFANVAQREEHLARRLRPMTIHSIRDSVQLRAELEAVVKVGYANEHGQSRLGTECIATPVMAGDVAVTGISITYPQGN
jgi:DNA-binding IclR family transcriptional regulator